MENITQYAIRTKELTFKQEGFNEVDALLFCQLLYNDLGCAPFNEDGRIYIRDLNDPELIERMSSITWVPKNDIELWGHVTQSSRYKDLEIIDFYEPDNYGEFGQFTGMVVEIYEDTKLVVFRGTDASFEGWRESLNMSFEPEIGAHTTAKEYLERVTAKYPGNFIVAGHSKGGNLVVFASSTVDSSIQDRIKIVYDFDGPGFLDEFYERDDYCSMEEKTIKYLPKQSIFGLLLKSVGKAKIINCKGLLIEEHYPYSWQIVDNKFERLKELDAISKFTYSAANKWMASVDRQERKNMIDTLYDVFSSSGATDLNEIQENRWTTFIKLKKIMDKIDKDDRALLKKNLAFYMDLFRKEIFNW